MPSLRSSIGRLARQTVASAARVSKIGGVCTALLFFGQRLLIYPAGFPLGGIFPTEEISSICEHLVLTTPDGFELRCFLLKQKKLPDDDEKSGWREQESDEEFAARRPTVLMFHGNGSINSQQIPIANKFYFKRRCNVFMLSYRGYNQSTGNPSEKGLRIDAQSALDYLLGHESLSKSPIILYGQSLGGAVAIDLASRNPDAIRAVIVENTFLSFPRLLPDIIPVLGPFAFLCHQKWDSASKIPLIPLETPMLFLSGMNDQVVPPAHMRSLLELAQKRVARGQRNGDGAMSPVAEAVPAPQTEEPSAPETEEVPDPQREAPQTEEMLAPVASMNESGDNPGEGYSRLVRFAGGNHNTTLLQPGYWRAIHKFVDALGYGEGLAGEGEAEEVGIFYRSVG